MSINIASFVFFTSHMNYYLNTNIFSLFFSLLPKVFFSSFLNLGSTIFSFFFPSHFLELKLQYIKCRSHNYYVSIYVSFCSGLHVKSAKIGFINCTVWVEVRSDIISVCYCRNRVVFWFQVKTTSFSRIQIMFLMENTQDNALMYLYRWHIYWS